MQEINLSNFISQVKNKTYKQIGAMRFFMKTVPLQTEELCMLKDYFFQVRNKPCNVNI
jgi:hypothetical protein